MLSRDNPSSFSQSSKDTAATPARAAAAARLTAVAPSAPIGRTDVSRKTARRARMNGPVCTRPFTSTDSPACISISSMIRAPMDACHCWPFAPCSRTPATFADTPVTGPASIRLSPSFSMLSVTPSVSSTVLLWSSKIGTLPGVSSPARSTTTGSANPLTGKGPPVYARMLNRRGFVPSAAFNCSGAVRVIGFIVSCPSIASVRKLSVPMRLRDLRPTMPTRCGLCLGTHLRRENSLRLFCQPRAERNTEPCG